MLSVKPDRPVEPFIVEVLRHIDTLTAQLALPYFVTGAMARDILLNNVFGLNAERLTRDIDFAIAVANWEQFETVKKRLIDSGRFTPDSSAMHRLYYSASGTTSKFPIDLIPFRGVEEPPRTIAWPPNMKVMMNVAGYEEVLATAVNVYIDVGLNVRIASLPGLALLKLFSWAARGNENSKDAEDFVMILRTYHLKIARFYGFLSIFTQGKRVFTMLRVLHLSEMVGTEPRIDWGDIPDFIAPVLQARTGTSLVDTVAQILLRIGFETFVYATLMPSEV